MGGTRERRIQTWMTGPVTTLALGWRSPVATATRGLPSMRDGPRHRITPWGTTPLRRPRALPTMCVLLQWGAGPALVVLADGAPAPVLGKGHVRGMMRPSKVWSPVFLARRPSG